MIAVSRFCLYNLDHVFFFCSLVASLQDKDEEMPTTTAVASNSHPVSRRTRLLKSDNHFVEGSFRSASVDEG